jgi:hypothetical protein
MTQAEVFIEFTKQMQSQAIVYVVFRVILNMTIGNMLLLLVTIIVGRVNLLFLI